MRRWTIDTNVPTVANGRHDQDRSLAPACRASAVRFLMRVLDKGERVVLDSAGDVQAEYQAYLSPSGQPGVGDRFYQVILSDWSRCERINLPKRGDGEYEDVPQALIDAGFDRSDRKFAALARRARVPVVNAVDSDWLDAYDLLAENEIRVKSVCGCDPARWFAP